MAWIHPWIGLNWILLGQDFGGILWIALDWIGLDDCGPVFQLVIVAAQSMLFRANYDL